MELKTSQKTSQFSEPKELTPFPWQPELIDKTVDYLEKTLSFNGENLFLNTCGTGIGKTFITLFALRKTNRPAFIICPKSVIDKWKKACRDVGVHYVQVINKEYITRHKKHSFGKWYRKDFIWDLANKDIVIIFDEVHEFQGETSKASKLLIGATEEHQCIALSASMYDRPDKLKAVGKAMKLHDGKSTAFKYWMQRHGMKRTDFGGFIYQPSKDQPSPLEEVRHLMVSKNHEDIPDFPKSRTFAEPLTLPDRDHQSFDNKYVRALVEAEEEALLPIVAQTRCRQYTEYLKISSLIDKALEYRLEGNSVVLFLNYIETINEVSDILEKKKIDHGCVYSGVSDIERKINIDKFQKNEIKVLVVAVAAGGQSIDLDDQLGGHPRVSIISPSYNPVHMMQVLGRIHRATAKTPSINILCFAANTIEDEIRKKVQKKIDAIGRLNKLGEEDLISDKEITYRDKYNLEQPGRELLKAKLEEKETMKKDNEEKELAEREVLLNTPQPLAHAQGDTDHSIRGHSKYSPSGMKSYRDCPGFTRDENSPTHPITEQGTRIHEALDAENSKLLNEDDDEEQELYDLCMGVQEQIIEEFEEQQGKDLTLIKEPALKFLQGTPYEQTGHIDVLVLDAGVTHADITDWKFGYNQVERADINLQGKGYSLGVFENYPTVQTVKVRFVQPRCDMISEHVFHRDPDVLKIREEYLRIISTVESPTKILNPKPDGACRYCKLNGSCTALNTKVVKQASVLSDDPDMIKPEELENMEDPRVRGRLLTLANWLIEWADAVKKSQMNWYREIGTEPEGYYLVSKKGSRSVSEPLLAYEAIKNEVPIEVFIEKTCKVSLGKLEKIYASHSPTKTTQGAKASLNHKLEELDAINPSFDTQYFRKQK